MTTEPLFGLGSELGPDTSVSDDIVAELDDLVDDNILNKGDKKLIVPQLQALISEQSSLDSQATAVGSTVASLKTTYDAAMSALNAELATYTTPFNWDDYDGRTTVDGSTFAVDFADAIEARDALKKGIRDSIPTLLSSVSDILSDNVLQKAEKKTLVPELQALIAEKTDLDTQAANVPVSSSSYDGAMGTLTTELAGYTTPVAWDNLTGKTTIVGATLTADIADVLKKRNQLLKAIRDGGLTALSEMTAAASDGVISRTEKKNFIRQVAAITNAQASLDAAATALGITTEKTTYDTAISTLTTYLATLTTPVAWNDKTGTTTVVSATLTSDLNAVATAQAALVSKIGQVAATLATWSTVTGTGKPADNATVNVTYRQGTTPTGGTYTTGDRWTDTSVTPRVHYTWTGSAWERIGGGGTATSYDVGTSGTGKVPTLDGSNTWSSPQTFAGVTLTSDPSLTSSGSSGRSLQFTDNGTVSGGTNLGGIYWSDSSGADINGASIQVIHVSTNLGKLDFRTDGTTHTVNGSTSRSRMRIQAGLIVGAPSPTGGDSVDDMGFGTVNVSGGFYINGVAVGGGAAAPLSTDKSSAPVAIAGSPTTHFTLPRAMAAGTEGSAMVWWNGAVQTPDQYTFNGTTTATMAFTMAVGDTYFVNLLAH